MNVSLFFLLFNLDLVLRVWDFACLVWGMRCRTSLVSADFRLLFWSPTLQTLLSGARCCPLIGQWSQMLSSHWSILLHIGFSLATAVSGLQSSMSDSADSLVCVSVFISKESTIATDKWDTVCLLTPGVKYKSQLFNPHLWERLCLNIESVCNTPSGDYFMTRLESEWGDDARWWAVLRREPSGHCGSSAKNVGLPPNIWTPLSHD